MFRFVYFDDRDMLLFHNCSKVEKSLHFIFQRMEALLFRVNCAKIREDTLSWR